MIQTETEAGPLRGKQRGADAQAGLPGPELKAASVVELACSPVLFQDSIHVVHFTQSLEEREEIEQLCVGHVIEPGRYRHLEGQGRENTSRDAYRHSRALELQVHLQ